MDINLIIESVEGLAILWIWNRDKIKSWFVREERAVKQEVKVAAYDIATTAHKVETEALTVKQRVEQLEAQEEVASKAAVYVPIAEVEALIKKGQRYTNAAGKVVTK